MRDLFVNENKAASESIISEEIELLPEESGQHVEIDVLQTEQFKESECSNCINLKLKIVKLQKRVSYLKMIRTQLYSRLEKVCILKMQHLQSNK